MMNDNTLRMLGVFKHYLTTVQPSRPSSSRHWLFVVTPFAITLEQPFTGPGVHIAQAHSIRRS